VHERWVNHLSLMTTRHLLARDDLTTRHRLPREQDSMSDTGSRRGDVLIVGGGSAGAVLAGRLSEDRARSGVRA
jgi:hypothetical protein